LAVPQQTSKLPVPGLPYDDSLDQLFAEAAKRRAPAPAGKFSPSAFTASALRRGVDIAEVPIHLARSLTYDPRRRVSKAMVTAVEKFLTGSKLSDSESELVQFARQYTGEFAGLLYDTPQGARVMDKFVAAVGRTRPGMSVGRAVTRATAAAAGGGATYPVLGKVMRGAGKAAKIFGTKAAWAADALYTTYQLGEAAADMLTAELDAEDQRRRYSALTTRGAEAMWYGVVPKDIAIIEGERIERREVVKQLEKQLSKVQQLIAAQGRTPSRDLMERDIARERARAYAELMRYTAATAARPLSGLGDDPEAARKRRRAQIELYGGLAAGAVFVLAWLGKPRKRK
jgi:hypothetical protein